eukprot:362506-Chlamydomonas_euryale.AAC.3
MRGLAAAGRAAELACAVSRVGGAAATESVAVCGSWRGCSRHLHGACMADVWRPSNTCSTSQHGARLADAWRPHGACGTSQHGAHTAYAWRTHGACGARLHGARMTAAWRTHGTCGESLHGAACGCMHRPGACGSAGPRTAAPMHAFAWHASGTRQPNGPASRSPSDSTVQQRAAAPVRSLSWDVVGMRRLHGAAEPHSSEAAWQALAGGSRPLFMVHPRHRTDAAEAMRLAEAFNDGKGACARLMPVLAAHMHACSNVHPPTLLCTQACFCRRLNVVPHTIALNSGCQGGTRGAKNYVNIHSSTPRLPIHSSLLPIHSFA